MNAYDKYLEFQFRQTGSFYTQLFELIAVADDENLNRIAIGFPEEVRAYLSFTRHGVKDFISKCTPGHVLINELLFESDMEEKI